MKSFPCVAGVNSFLFCRKEQTPITFNNHWAYVPECARIGTPQNCDIRKRSNGDVSFVPYFDTAPDSYRHNVDSLEKVASSLVSPERGGEDDLWREVASRALKPSRLWRQIFSHVTVFPHALLMWKYKGVQPLCVDSLESVEPDLQSRYLIWDCRVSKGWLTRDNLWHVEKAFDIDPRVPWSTQHCASGMIGANWLDMWIYLTLSTTILVSTISSSPTWHRHGWCRAMNCVCA